jgi:hypothetical protein
VPPVVLAGGAVIAALLIAVVVLLAMTLGEMRTSRAHIEAQDAKVSALLRRSQPTFEQVPDLAEQAQPLLNRAAPLLGSLLAARPRIDEIAGRVPLLMSSLQGLASEGVPLARELRAADIPALVATLSDSGLPGTLASLQTLIADLQSGGRLENALDATTAVLGDVQARDLPRRAVASSRRIRELLAVQRRAYGVLQRSLDVQQRTLRHTRNIDERLGGALPGLTGG